MKLSILVTEMLVAFTQNLLKLHPMYNTFSSLSMSTTLVKRPARDACLCMGELPAPHFVFLITL